MSLINSTNVIVSTVAALVLSLSLIQPVLADDAVATEAKKPTIIKTTCKSLYFSCQTNCRQLDDSKQMIACMNNQCTTAFNTCKVEGIKDKTPSYLMLLFHLPL